MSSRTKREETKDHGDVVDESFDVERWDESHDVSENLGMNMCEFCNYQTKNKANLKRHLRVHYDKDDCCGSKGNTDRRTKRSRVDSGSEDEDCVRDDVHLSKNRKVSASKMPLNGLRSPSFSSSNKPAELFRKDLISAMKLPDSEPLSSEEYIFIADPWRQEWERGVQVPVNMAAVRNAEVIEVRPKEKSGDFKMPKKFLHAVPDETYKQGNHELTGMQQLIDQVVRYDLDDLDVSWLQLLNDEREVMGQDIIYEWTMERIIEAFELECHEKMSKTIKTEEGLGIEYDEDVICDVCRSPDSEEGNEMVFCDGCDICVHQACYGVQTIPEGNWLCRTCALGIKPPCILCPNFGGAMKSTKSGTKWSHVSCALWIPEVSIGCVEKMEPIIKISHVPASRWALCCCLCKERVGACIQCSVKTCKVAFHVTCAVKNNMEMKTLLDDSEDADGIRLKAFCPKHSKKKDGSGTESDVDSPKKSAPPTPKKELTKEERENLRAEKLGELEEDFFQLVNLKETADKLQVDIEVVDLIYSFWKLKRKSMNNKSLLTPKTDEADILEKQQEDSLVARMKMFVHLRQDLERVRNLCYMVSRREKFKKQYYKLKETVFLAQLSAIKDKRITPTDKEAEKMLKVYRPTSLYDGFPDLNSFLPRLGQYTKELSPRLPIDSDAMSISSIESIPSKSRLTKRKRKTICENNYPDSSVNAITQTVEVTADIALDDGDDNTSLGQFPEKRCISSKKKSKCTPRRSRTHKSESEMSLKTEDLENVEQKCEESGDCDGSKCERVPHSKADSDVKQCNNDEITSIADVKNANDVHSSSASIANPPSIEKVANLPSKHVQEEPTKKNEKVNFKSRKRVCNDVSDVLLVDIRKSPRIEKIASIRTEDRKEHSVLREISRRPPFSLQEKNVPENIKRDIDLAKDQNKLLVNGKLKNKVLNGLINSKRLKRLNLKLDKRQRKIDYFFSPGSLDNNGKLKSPDNSPLLENPSIILNHISPSKDRQCSENNWFGTQTSPREDVLSYKVSPTSPLEDDQLTFSRKNSDASVENLVSPDKKVIRKQLVNSFENLQSDCPGRKSGRQSRELTPDRLTSPSKCDERVQTRSSTPSSLYSCKTGDSVDNDSNNGESSSRRITRRQLRDSDHLNSCSPSPKITS